MESLTLKPLPPNHGKTIIELWIVCRDRGSVVEIAEHPDGALKSYASKKQAEDARNAMDPSEQWTVNTIWLLHKGADVCPEAMALAESGLFSEQAVRSIDGLMTTLRNRRG